MIAEKPAEAKGARPNGVHRERRAARLAAVQALYQIEIAATTPASVIAEFVAHRLNRSIDGERASPSDRAHFVAVVEGVSRRPDDIDQLVGDVLGEGWSLKRLGALLRAMMRAAAFELLEIAAIPARVVIDEYVEIAASFFSDREPAFVNGALDQLARRLRPSEFDAPVAVASNAGPGPTT
ncbi:MAG: transcription antitermination factor NusB [Alphaproteobacteria bacterium]|nr:transcription antitermination factor NusB [Alphaproteobacteria bacterium]